MIQTPPLSYSEGARAMGVHDPLLAGFFSISDASHLVGATPAAIRGWLDGYPTSKSGPVIERDFAGTRALSFLDLMEIRFVAIFRAQKVTMPTLRRAAERARKEWQVSHPLALSSVKYVTDRKTVFAISAEEENDHIAWDMATGQHEMWETIERTIEKGVTFDLTTHLAKSWTPRPAQFPDVIIDPRIAFGKAAVKGTRVPTEVLFRQWKADGQKDRVAHWFLVPIEAVETAIEYELLAA